MKISVLYFYLCLIGFLPSWRAAGAPLDWQPTWEFTESEQPLQEPSLLNGWRSPDHDMSRLRAHADSWFRARLPELPQNGAVLSLPDGTEDVRIFVDDELRYSYGRFDKSDQYFTSHSYHWIVLRPEDSRKTLHLNLHFAANPRPTIDQLKVLAFDTFYKDSFVAQSYLGTWVSGSVVFLC
jgi:hypothetical protein